jgi:hypothetical protein
MGEKDNNNNKIIDNNNSDFITPSFSKSEMITKLNEWKELYLNDVESYCRVGELEEAVTVLNDFVMYVRYLD